MFRSIPMLALAVASPALAAPMEPPLKDQAAVLHYEIEVTGQDAGKSLRQRLIVETPVRARESGAFHPLARDFTAGQNAEFEQVAAAAQSAGDGTEDMLEANRLILAMEGACSNGESPACGQARERFNAAQQRLTDREAARTDAAAAVVRRDEDDHRFLTFAPGSDGCGTVRYEHQLGERRVESLYPFPGSPEAGLVACMTMVVLDRRDGSISLQMSPATLKVEAGRIVDLERLQGAKDLRFGALRMSLTLPMLPTAGPDQDFAGSHTLKAGGLTYVFRWTLRRA